MDYTQQMEILEKLHYCKNNLNLLSTEDLDALYQKLQLLQSNIIS